MRIFFGTNVLASGLMGHGLCRDLLDRAVIEHAVVLGAPVREELHRVLTSKFRVPDNLWRELKARLGDLELAPPADDPPPTAVSDPDDVPILACAVAAKVDVFVSGDKALLDLGTVEGIPILSPRELWQKLSGLSREFQLAGHRDKHHRLPPASSSRRRALCRDERLRMHSPVRASQAGYAPNSRRASSVCMSRRPSAMR